MMKIKKIIRKGKNSLLILSGGREYIIAREIVQEYSLQPGAEIDEEAFRKIRLESDLHRAKEYATYLLAKRSYSTGLLKDKMEEKGYDRKIIGIVLKELLEKELINDVRFARQITESMLQHKPAGRDFIIATLRKKKIPRSLAISTVDEFFGSIEEADIALRLLRSRWRYFSKFELDRARRKAYNYLSRRSISYRSAKLAFDRMLKEEEQD